MKRVGLVFLTLLILVGITTFASQEMRLQTIYADNSLTNKHDGAGENNLEKQIDSFKNRYNYRDIDWINDNVEKNFTVYHEKGSLTDFGLNSAHMISELFMSLNIYIVYPLFDKALATMFDLANITSGIDSVFKNVQTFTKKAWVGEVFKQMLYLAFGIGVVWAFIQTIKNGSGTKAILTVLLTAVLGGAWISAGGTVLTKVNQFTSTAQTMLFTDVNSNSSDQSYNDVDDFQKKIRKSFFNSAIVRPYVLANFGKTTLEDSEKQGSYKLIVEKPSDDTISSLAQDNSYLAKDGGQEWYQVSVAFMSSIMSAAYGVPLMMIGAFNLVVQLGSILLYYLAPFTVLMSLLPRFSNSALKTGMAAIGLLFAKVGLLFSIMFVSWIGAITDTVIPVKDSASALLNSIIYIVLMFLLWKNKSFLVETITGSSVANQALDRISMTKLGRGMRNQASKFAHLSGSRAGAPHEYQDGEPDSDSDKPDEKRGYGAEDDRSERRSHVPDDDEAQEIEAQRQAAREAELLRDSQGSFNDRTDNDYTDELATRRAYHGRQALDEDLPTYKRTPYLIKRPIENGSLTGYGAEESDKAFKARTALVDETDDETAKIRREARSKVLQAQHTRQDKLQGRHFDEVIYEKHRGEAAELSQLEEELSHGKEKR
ncbi:ABC transporter permease [Weissella confusa]|uniref:ABC transporter permease n=1 Tax=Weissella confusa TaxID=1583 RepID=UPI001C6F693B|nr:ABC transporter permease [Weissella confusa]QYU58821.1 ABC transporter permease [Weissella confusa]